MDPVAIVVLGAYVSLLLELVCFPIPSEASTYQILFEDDERDPHVAGAPLAGARGRTSLGKLLRYLLPTALGVALFAIPPIALLVPELPQGLWPIHGLETPAARWLGIGLVVAGRAITFLSALQLRRQKRANNLQARGLFLLSRNPGLVGMYLFYLGNAFLFPCVVLFLGFLPYVLNMHRRVLMEEGHLLGSIGEDYRRYAEQVPRYLRMPLLR